MRSTASDFLDAFSFSLNSRVPDLAIVPMRSLTSSRDMPTPESRMVNVRAPVSGSSQISSAVPSGNFSGSDTASKRRRSNASDALEINSRKKISLCE
jgi:hypothetical protein